MPNMDEVAEQVKLFVDTFPNSDTITTKWLRLLIEEREQKDAEIERLKENNKYLDQCLLENHSLALKRGVEIDEQEDLIESLQALLTKEREANTEWQRQYDKLLERKRRIEKYIPDDQRVVLDEVMRQSVIDKAKLLEYLENELRTYKELGSAFDERRLELTALRNEIIQGTFDAVPLERKYLVVIQKAIVDLRNLRKYEIASFAHPQLPMVNDMIDDLIKAIKGADQLDQNS
jgi:predicted protein tyrosine phosphatase